MDPKMFYRKSKCLKTVLPPEQSYEDFSEDDSIADETYIPDVFPDIKCFLLCNGPYSTTIIFSGIPEITDESSRECCKNKEADNNPSLGVNIQSAQNLFNEFYEENSQTKINIDEECDRILRTINQLTENVESVNEAGMFMEGNSLNSELIENGAEVDVLAEIQNDSITINNNDDKNPGLNNQRNGKNQKAKKGLKKPSAHSSKQNGKENTVEQKKGQKGKCS
ncbi:hypothetical protein RN001_016050 [Aquatica leii]|uniref:Uncharacterized protein n=1 Tax=Aquatica leii TaxID=1421715 RepID=A0AAN7P181_9COLE|nr:hypothetical protein RN001_016050 [Aquatica leii]